MGDTLIRAVLHLDPAVLDDDEWVTQIMLSEWSQYQFLGKLSRMFNGSSEEDDG